MKCNSCKGNIASGPEAQKMIVQYVQGDGTFRFYGYMMSDGTLAQAEGSISRAWHHKCFHVVRKREARGDAVTGRVLNGLPTAYELDNVSVQDIERRLDELREIAREVGRPLGDPAVHEAHQAKLHGGPYEHTHTMPMDNYQLRFHLHYAHGLDLDDPSLVNRRILHDTAHRQDHQPDPFPDQRDWRDHVVADVDDLI